MSSIGDVKDDQSEGTRDLSIVFIVVYSAFWAYTAHQLYKLYSSSVIFRLIHALILLFLTLRVLFWFDIVADYGKGVYFVLQSFPNFILYNIGQILCYAWFKIRFELARKSERSMQLLKIGFIASNVTVDLLFFICMVVYYNKEHTHLDIAMFIVTYNSANAVIDFCLLAYSGHSLLKYIATYMPHLDTKKIKQSIWACALFYLGRSVLLISLMIVEIQVNDFNYDDSASYWVLLKLVYYLLTDLVFIVMLNVIVKSQVKQDSEFQKFSEEHLNTRGYTSSTLHRTFVDS